MIAERDVVVVEWSFEAQPKGPFAGHVATSARVKVPGCGVYEYDSAKRQITAARIYFDMGTLLQIITDSLVDDRKKTEEALQSNERNLSLITNIIPTLIHVLRTDGTVLYVNQAVLSYTGSYSGRCAERGLSRSLFPPGGCGKAARGAPGGAHTRCTVRK